MKKAPNKAGDSRISDLPKSDVNVCARLFHAVSLFAAQRDVRYYLISVYVEAGPAGGAVLCACNGHQMALAFDPIGKAPKDGCIISLTPGLKVATRAAKVGGRVLIVGDRVRVYGLGAREVYIQPGQPLIDANYPEWERVIPAAADLKPQAQGSWQAGLLDRLTAAGRFLAGRGFTGLTHWQRPAASDAVKDAGAMLTRYTSEPNFVAVTMPFRADPDVAVPQFLAPAIEARKLRSEARDKAKKAARQAADAAAAAATEG